VYAADDDAICDNVGICTPIHQALSTSCGTPRCTEGWELTMSVSEGVFSLADDRNPEVIEIIQLIPHALQYHSDVSANLFAESQLVTG